MIIFLPLLIALIGLLMYAFSNNSKVGEIGRIMFFAGLFAFLIAGPSTGLRIDGGQAIGLLGK